MERRLAAILAADMVGYSRAMAADEDGTIARLKTLRRDIIDPEIARAGGETVKLTGDGMLVLFGSIVAAVGAAASIQKALAADKAAAPPETRIAFRIGVHVGDIVLDEGDIYGDGINIAVRLEALADPGGVTISDDAYRQVRGKTDLAFVDLGALALKNIPEPVRVHRLDLAAAPAPGSGASRSASDRPSIAVLPFQNMSTDPEQEYFCDGVAEDIITELSRFPELFVIARNSSFSFKGRPVTHRDVARALGVRYMLEGSLRRAAGSVRITAQLIDCASGAHVWAERYDRALDDIFALQDEITRNVVGAIAPQISRAEIGRASEARDLNFSSYDLALKALALFHEGAYASAEGHDEVVATAGRALALDPHNSLALWIQAYAYAMRYLYQFDADPARALDLAEAASERLFRGGQAEPRALTVRAMIRHFRGDFDGATADFRLAFQLNPNFALNINLMAWHESLVGQTAEAREHAELALRLSPRDSDVWVGGAYLTRAQACFAEGKFREAMDWGDRAIQMTPQAPIRRALMIASAAHLDLPAAGRRHAEALASFAPAFIDSLISGRLELYRLPEHNALMVEGLKKARANP